MKPESLDFGKLKSRSSNALSVDGVLFIENINQDLIDGLYKEAKRFFDAPRATKNKYNTEKFPCANWGYSSNRVREILESCPATDFSEFEGYENLADGSWPTDADFPQLSNVFSEVTREWEGLYPIFDGCGQTALTVFRYKPSSASFKFQGHTDPAYFVAFKPQGEPLEVMVKGKWYAPELNNGQALIVAPGTRHRVRNTTGQERSSAIFFYPIDPV